MNVVGHENISQYDEVVLFCGFIDALCECLTDTVVF